MFAARKLYPLSTDLRIPPIEKRGDFADCHAVRGMTVDAAQDRVDTGPDFGCPYRHDKNIICTGVEGADRLLRIARVPQDDDRLGATGAPQFSQLLDDLRARNQKDRMIFMPVTVQQPQVTPEECGADLDRFDPIGV